MVKRYPKVEAIFDLYFDMIQQHRIFVQEKFDGSQFRVEMNGDLQFGSHYKDGSIDGMFNPAIQYISSVIPSNLSLENGDSLFFEFLGGRKQNTLMYERVPLNNLVLFDAQVGGQWLPSDEVQKIAHKLNVEFPVTTEVRNITKETVSDLLKIKSQLGGSREGIVLKCYEVIRIQYPAINEPIFLKFVSAEFREQNRLNWKSKKLPLEQLIDVYRNENRWQKAFQRLFEEGLITNSMKDLGLIAPLIVKDLEEEEKENIKEYLWNEIGKIAVKKSIKGLPEWYKKKLAGAVEESQRKIQ